MQSGRILRQLLVRLYRSDVDGVSIVPLSSIPFSYRNHPPSRLKVETETVNFDTVEHV